MTTETGSTAAIPPEESADGGGRVWPRIVHDGAWVAPDGVRWRRRGGALDERAIRRLARREGVLVLHVAGPTPTLLDAPERAAVLSRLLAHLDGCGSRHADFTVGEFRDDARRVLLVVEESC